MTIKLTFALTGALAVTLMWCKPVAAAFVFSPVAASTNMGRFGTVGNDYRIENVINRSGLSAPFVSGVTDFEAYIASNPTHSTFAAASIWASQTGTTTGNVDFDLGGAKDVAALALWNFAATSITRVTSFDLLASMDNTFSSATSLGSFTTNTVGGASAVQVQVFNFPSTQAAFVRMQITGNAGNNATGIAEVAFSIPEPATLSLPACAGVLCLRRRVPPVTTQTVAR